MSAAGIRSGRIRFLLLAPTFALIAFFVVGVVSLVWSSVVVDGAVSFSIYADILQRASYQRVMIRTIWIALAVTALCLLIGYPLAYFIARSRHKNLLLVLVISPWLVSLVVRTFGWMVLLGNTGIINKAIIASGLSDVPVQLIYNPAGVIIGLVHVFVPFVVIAILSVLLVIDPALEEAGMSLGARPFRTFLRVTWPLSLPGVFSGASLVYLLSSGAIVTPLLLGGLRDRMMGTQIYQEVFQVFNADRAAAMSVILLATSLVVILPLQAFEAMLRRRREI